MEMSTKKKTRIIAVGIVVVILLAALVSWASFHPMALEEAKEITVYIYHNDEDSTVSVLSIKTTARYLLDALEPYDILEYEMVEVQDIVGYEEAEEPEVSPDAEVPDGAEEEGPGGPGGPEGPGEQEGTDEDTAEEEEEQLGEPIYETRMAPYITTVEGEYAYPLEGQYWAYNVNGVLSTNTIDIQEIKDGDYVSFYMVVPPDNTNY